MSGALGFMPGSLVFVAATKGMFLDYFALVTREACVPVFLGTTAIGEIILGRLPPPGHCAISGLRHSLQYFCEEGIFACLGASELRGRLRVWHIPIGLWSCS